MFTLERYIAQDFIENEKLLDEFTEFIYNGGSVTNKDYISSNLKRIDYLLALYYVNDDTLEKKLVGTIALKNPTDNYIIRVFESINRRYFNEIFKKEIGYCVIEKDFRNKKFAQLLNKILFYDLIKIKNIPIFITCRSDNKIIKNILQKYNNYVIFVGSFINNNSNKIDIYISRLNK